MNFTYAETPGAGELSGSAFKGYIRQPMGQPDSFVNMQNMSGVDWPLIHTRDKRRKLRTISNFNGLCGGDKLLWVSGTKLYYGGESVGTVANGKKTFCPMGAYILILPDKKLFHTVNKTLEDCENTVTLSGVITYESCDYLGEKKPHGEAVYVKISASGIHKGFSVDDVVTLSGSEAGLNGDALIEQLGTGYLVVLGTLDADTVTQTGGLTLSRTMPDMDYVTECDNRIWGCSSAKHEIYACKLGDAKNWNAFQGLSTDSFVLSVGSAGDFTGAVTHMGYVIFFKEKLLHKIYGNKPSNYQLTNSFVRGVMKGSAGSLCVMQETLYYLSPDGCVYYEGALPDALGEALGNVRYKNALAGGCRNILYWSLEDADGAYHLFTYSAKTGNWHREDDIRAAAFAECENDLYMADTGGNLWCLTGAGDDLYAASSAAYEGALAWYVETGDMTLETLENKFVQKALLRYELEEGSEITISIRYDGGEWEKLKTFSTQDKKRMMALPVIPRRCDRFALKLSGTGHMRLYNFNLGLQGGTELYAYHKGT